MVEGAWTKVHNIQDVSRLNNQKLEVATHSRMPNLLFGSEAGGSEQIVFNTYMGPGFGGVCTGR